MAKKYHKIGSMIEKRDKATGQPVLDIDGKKTYYLRIDKDADIRINGKKVTGFLNVNRPYEYHQRQFVQEKISEQDYADKKARFEKGGDLDYIQFELQAVTED
jgi:hypothetical protein